MHPLTSIAALFALGLVHIVAAQDVKNAVNATLGYLPADGQVQNSSRTTMGYFTENGSGWTLESSDRIKVGYIHLDGKEGYSYEDGSHLINGYVHRKGDTWIVTDAKQVVEGYINKDGKVEDGTRSTLGYAPLDVPPVWVAVHFFFLRIQ